MCYHLTVLLIRKKHSLHKCVTDEGSSERGYGLSAVKELAEVSTGTIPSDPTLCDPIFQVALEIWKM